MDLMQSRRRDKMVNLGTVRDVMNRQKDLEQQGYDRKTASEQVKREAVAAMQKRAAITEKERVRVAEREETHQRALDKEVRRDQQAFDIQAEKTRLEAEAKEAKTPSEALAKERLQISKEEAILDPEESFVIVKFKAEKENSDPAGTTYYVVNDPSGGDDWIPFNESDGDIVPIRLPNNPDTGKPITNKDLQDTAKANNITEEEVLKAWGLL